MKALLALPLFGVLMAPAQAPAGWEDAYRRGTQLMADGKAEQAIAIFERAVGQAPDFDAARAPQ
jgi:hypothetical protein